MRYIAIVGSRDYHDKAIVEAKLAEFRHKYKYITVVSGGAKGPDSFAEQWAKRNQINCIVYLPDWSLGKYAGYARNKQIVDKCDELIAFWDGISNGTNHSILLAKQQNKPVTIYGRDKELIGDPNLFVSYVPGGEHAIQ